MREFDSRYIDGVLDGAGQYQLDVDVNSVTFTHHHLFSREHVLASRLTQLFSNYTLRRNKNMVHFLTDKVGKNNN
jgi:coiled-coil and C2 domain-containing protein 2A